MKKFILYVFALMGLIALVTLIVFYGASLMKSFSLQSNVGAVVTNYQVRSMAASVPLAVSDESNSAGMTAAKGGSSTPDSVMRRMIIRNANLTLVVSDISGAIKKMTQLADRSGGYVVSSNFSEQDPHQAVLSSAQMRIRVPAKGLNSALTQLKSMAIQVLQQSISGEDITRQFVNLESQLKNLQAAKVQLTKIMQGATKTADVLSVYQELVNTQGQIDVLVGQIKYYKESVAFSLITINLQVNPDLKVVSPTWQFKAVAISAYNSLVHQLKNLAYGLIQLIIYIPLILIWGVILLALYWVGKKIYHRFK